MDIKQASLSEVLSQVPIFSKLHLDDVGWLAGIFQPVVFRAGDLIFEMGDDADAFYVIYEGKVVLSYEDGNAETLLAKLGISDFFGEEALLYDDPRYYQAVASGNTVLLRLDVDHFLEIIDDLPGIETMLDVCIQSRRLSTQVSLPWLHADEYVHVMMRRHPAILWSRLLIPVVFGMGMGLLAALMQFVWLPENIYGWVTFAIVFPVFLLWVIWSYFDWRNDYFIVTNKRVVWIEKIAFIYESRQEAPLRTIMSVGIHRSRVGTLLGYGDVVVTTYVGTIRLGEIAHTETTATLIESYWHRSDSSNRKEEAEMMARKLQEKLDLPLLEEVEAIDEVLPSSQEPMASEYLSETKEPGFIAWLFSDFIRLRYEQDGAITYRKHWFVLIEHMWLPALLMILAVFGLVLRLSGQLAFIPITAGMAGVFLFMFVVFLWMIYVYVDWRNDLFIVTLDQIIDLDRKPLGKVRRRSAPLENVLSIEYERLGLWGYLFNYGTVYIIVGNMRLSFDHVYHPSEVQEDIFYRMGERLEKARQFEIDAERERVSEWIASYHRSIAATRDKTQHGHRRKGKSQ
jgi:hypothetical protein